MQHLVAPSLLSADFLHLADEIEMINQSEADWFHLDIMDGVFVPNITFGFSIIEQIKQLSKKPLDVHLMITEPDRYIQEFKKSGADIITVHYEACTHLHRTIQKIKSLGIKAGVALNPHTPVHILEEIIIDLDVVLIMSVNPGFGGQHFIESTYKKIEKLKNLILNTNSGSLIAVDGGVVTTNAAKLVESGTHVLIAGSAVFKSINPKDTLSQLKHLNK
jgi:ribulose-phosphate 3-epimerase